MKTENQGTRFIIRIDKYLDSSWEHWFEGMNITHTEEGVTILSGEVVDQSALFGLLERLHALNLTLISFQKVEPESMQ